MDTWCMFGRDDALGRLCIYTLCAARSLGTGHPGRRGYGSAKTCTGDRRLRMYSARRQDPLFLGADRSSGRLGVGIETGANALWTQTAQLPEIEIKRPNTILSKNTKTEMQGGIFYQYLGGVEYTIRQYRKELGNDFKVVATGGLGRVVCSHIPQIDVYDPNLIFKGLKVIYDKNKETAE